MNPMWCDGRYCDAAELRIAATDRGASHGLGIFETLLAVNGVLPFGRRHWARLENSLAQLGWPPPHHDLASAAAALLEKHGLGKSRARIRLAITAGSGAPDDCSSGDDRLCWMTAAPLAARPASLRLTLSPWRRNEHSPLAGLKCASYAENLLALDHARRLGFDETIFLNTAGELCEAAMANVFIVRDGALFTPALDSGCLPGVAREVMIALAARAGIACHEARLDIAALAAADEVFLTSAVRGPVAACRIDSRVLREAPLAALLAGAWEDEIAAAVQCGGDRKPASMPHSDGDRTNFRQSVTDPNQIPTSLR